MNKILIIDDNYSDRELLKEILLSSTVEYDIQTAESVDHAFDIIKKNPPDLILSDLYMQERNGFEFLDKLKQMGDDAFPVILVSGFTNENDRLRGLELGATDFITKPIFPEEVRARVIVQMKIKRMSDDARWVAKETNKGIKTLYRELEKKNTELKKFDRLKSDFISTVSHELRTPLAIIRQGVSLLQRKILGDVNAQQNETLSDVLENIDRLVKIINGLLDISKLESGSVELIKTKVDAIELVKKITKDFQPKVQEKGILLQVELPEVLPLIEGDRDSLIQVLTNLLGNAIKFTPKEGKIIVRANEIGEMVKISVLDSGIGIAKENMTKLFEKFQQFGRTSGPGEMGTGLGLAISKEIIKLHEGEMGVESELKKGSTFYFTVPQYVTAQVKCTRVVQKQITDFQKNRIEGFFSIVILTIANIDIIKSSMGQEACEKAITDILDCVNKQISRTGDLAMPYSFGKIMILLPQTDLRGAISVSAKIKKAVDPRKIVYADHPVPVFMQFGAASYPKSGDNPEMLIKAAEAEFIRVKKVLIVDDHPQVTRLLKLHLEAEGKFECRQAANGEEALTKTFELIPDLIICDIFMPKMNGYEFIGRLKGDEKTRDISIIILTAHQVDTTKIQSLSSGSIPIITKTAAFEKIIDMVNQVI